MAQTTDDRRFDGGDASRIEALEAEVQRLQEEVDALRDFVLSGPMSAESYRAFCKIPSYADRKVALDA